MKKLLTIDMSQNRIFGLDLLRFFAIFFVLMTHSGYFLPFRQYTSQYRSVIYDGVGIFFVLSGFLIGGILIKEIEKKKISFNLLFNFWINRWTRTLPNYYLFLVIFILFDLVFIPEPNSDYYSYYFVFLQNLTHNVYPFFGASWSLSVEEWFYIISPIIIFSFILLKLKPKTSFLLTAIVILISVNILRCHYYINNTITSYKELSTLIYSVIYRLDGIMYGMLASYISAYYPSLWKKLRIPGLITAFIGLGFYYFSEINNQFYFRALYSFTLTSVTIFFLLPFLSTYKAKRNVFTKSITYISLISYSLYLINSLVQDTLAQAIDYDKVYAFVETNITKNHTWGLIFFINYTLFWVASIVLSVLNYKYFEFPTTKKLRTFLIKK